MSATKIELPGAVIHMAPEAGGVDGRLELRPDDELIPGRDQLEDDLSEESGASA